MKPTEKQVMVADRLASYIKHVIGETNDINSPSHWTLIEEEAYLLASDVSNGDEDHEAILERYINDALTEVLIAIKRIE